MEQGKVTSMSIKQEMCNKLLNNIIVEVETNANDFSYLIQHYTLLYYTAFWKKILYIL